MSPVATGVHDRHMIRDDLFTHIHKALRKGLFDLTVLTGATDWEDPDQVALLGTRWRQLHALLESHTRHEDDHILRLLDGRDGGGPTGLTEEQHRDLDDLLGHVAQHFDVVLTEPDPAAGLALYRDLARFVAAYLPHLHQEETEVMPAIWQRCSDAEIAGARAAFMAEITPEESALSIELMLPALDRRTRAELVGNLASRAPAPVVEGAMAAAARVLPAEEVARLRAVAEAAGQVLA